MAAEALYYKKLLGTIRTVVKDGGEEVVRMVHVAHGDRIPDTVPKEELDRLKARGAVGPKATVSVLGTEPVGEQPASPKTVRKAAALPDLATLDDDGLAKLLVDDKPGVKKLVEAVGDNAELAGRLIVAEKHAASTLESEPRGTLISQLEKVAGGANS